MSLRRWCIAKSDKKLSRSIAQKFGIDGFTAHLLSSRGFVTDDAISEMLGFDDGGAEFIDPFTIIDMDKAVSRVRSAIDSFEKIAVYGDYDVDGVTSTSIVFSYLESNDANVTYYIPSRDNEGYGLNRSAIDKLHEQAVSLIVTVDNGITAVDEVDYANSLGIDVIITDHHCAGEKIPNAVAVVNPHRRDSKCPFTEYAGVGVAFKFLCALDGDSMAVMENCGDLVALGTIADVVSLTGENRKLVRFGLEIIQNTERIGLKTLIDMAGLNNKTITSSSVAFVIAPRINAAGRLGNAERAVRLLISEDEDEAIEIAEQLTNENKERQTIERIINREVSEMISKNPSMLYDRVLVIAGEKWHGGVIGIFASRLCDRYGKPCIIISYDGDEAKGSGRSIEGFPLYDAIFSCSDLLTGFGGHTLAAGVNLKTENIDAFRKAINSYAAREFSDMPAPVLNIDCQLPPSMLNLELLNSAGIMEPFGADNPTPVIAVMGLKITEIFGAAGGKHQKITMERDGAIISAMKFSTLTENFPFCIGDTVDIAVTLDKTVFREKESLTIVIRDIRLSETRFDEINNGARLYEKLMRGEELSSEEIRILCPKRGEVGTIYRIAAKGYGGGADVLGCRLKRMGINYAKMLTSLQILTEGGLIECKDNGTFMTISPAQAVNSDEKVALENTPTAIRIGYSNT